MRSVQPQPLDEGLGSYTAPTDPTKLLFDFYSLNAMAIRFGTLSTHYDHRSDLPSTVHFRIAEAVDNAYHVVTEKLRGLMLKKLPLLATRLMVEAIKKSLCSHKLCMIVYYAFGYIGICV